MSADKRASTIGSGLSFLTVLPRADSNISAADRAHTTDLYRGIATGSPAPIPKRDEGHLTGGILPMAGGLA